MRPDDLAPGRFALAVAAVLLVGAILRGLFPTADPPWNPPVGITWHDEGPWTHNARNRVLWGEWKTDEWNPMYLAPVFTALEYASFAVFGVGFWQARLVSEFMGLLSVLALAYGVAAVSTRWAGLAASALLATNYVYVMWNRAALMEATMVAFIAISWSAYALARRRAWWGLVAGVCAVLAFFTKAAAAFYAAALGIDVLWTLIAPLVWRRLPTWQPQPAAATPGVAAVEYGLTRSTTPADSTRDAATADRARALWTLTGLAVAGGAFLVWFVVPFWAEFRFYNWQMSVTRKPSYTPGAFVDRTTWLPIIHDFFTRMWLATVVALVAVLGIVSRWPTLEAGRRLLASWVVLGTAELLVHDVGNQRRLIFFVPALLALTAIALVGDRRLLPGDLAGVSRRRALLAAPLILYAAYIATGSMVRLPYLYEVRPGVRTAFGIAVALTVALYVWWPRIAAWVARQSWSVSAALAVVGIVLAGDLVQYAQWAAGRTYKNLVASRMIGDLLPPGTLVHGKLANGLALENRIKPVFVGRGFGNYDDRQSRPDIRYVLTYIAPRIGYEGPVITDVLEAHPGWRILNTFDVAETATGHDRAALIEKPAGSAAALPGPSLAHD
jgi:hypothetical protein